MLLSFAIAFMLHGIPALPAPTTYECTAYSASEYEGGPRTAIGTEVHPGVVAADPDVLPMGTWVFVPGYGLARVEDKGGAIRGRRLDLAMATRGECVEWGRRERRVWVNNAN